MQKAEAAKNGGFVSHSDIAFVVHAAGRQLHVKGTASRDGNGRSEHARRMNALLIDGLRYGASPSTTKRS